MTENIKLYGNLIKLHSRINKKGCFKPISDAQYLIEYNSYKQYCLMMIANGTEAVSIGDWNDLEENPTDIIIYYKTDAQGFYRPRIMEIPISVAKPHIKKKGDDFVLDLSSVKSYFQENKDKIDKLEFVELH